VTINLSKASEREFPKIIIMSPSDCRISMLKRQIEQEFSDLFPNESTFICAKLLDARGYALSNNSFVYDLLKYGDTVYASPEQLSQD